MKIENDSAVEEWFYKTIQTNWDQYFGERPGIHVTDLLTPRKTFWRKLKPIPSTVEQILYFIAGRGHEGGLLRTLNLPHGKAIERNGIYFSPDIEGIPLCPSEPGELKTRRRKLAELHEAEETYKHYLKQLLCYCLAKRTRQGRLWVLSLVEQYDASRKTQPQMQFQEVFSYPADTGP